MSEPLKDLGKLKVTPRTHAWLLAESRTSGRPAAEIVREALDAIAAQKIHAAKVLAALAEAEGHGGGSEGRGRDGGGA